MVPHLEYAILIVIQDTSIGVLSNGLLPELLTIFEFLPVPQLITCIGGWLGVVRSHKVAGKTHVL